MVAAEANGEVKWEQGRVRRASVTSRLYRNMLLSDPDRATYVCGLLTFGEDIGFSTVQDIVKQRLLTIPRFRSRCTKKGFVELAEDEFDMDFHVEHVQEEITVQEIQDQYVGQLYAHYEIDKFREMPLWKVSYFSNVGGKSVLLTKIAHAIGDGVSQIEVLFRLLDPQDHGENMHATMGIDEEMEEDGDDDEEGGAAGDGEGGTPSAAAAVGGGPASKSTAIVPVADVKQPADAAAAAGGSLRPPKKRRPPKAFGPLTRARIVLGGVGAALTAVFGTPDSANPLMRTDFRTPSKVKKTAFTEAIPLDKLKELKVRFKGATLNDILVALLTLTLKAYLNDVDPNARVLKGKGKLRAGFPINNRKRNEDAFKDGSPHNSLALGTVKFQFGKGQSRTKLVYTVKRTLDQIKLSPSPLIQNKIANTLIRVLPTSTTSALFQKVGDQTTGMLSNVAGPQKKVHLGGYEVEDLRFLIYGTMGLYMGLLSYAGSVSCGICLDESLGDPHHIAKFWKTEFDALYEETMAFPGQVPKPRSLKAYLDKL